MTINDGVGMKPDSTKIDELSGAWICFYFSIRKKYFVLYELVFIKKTVP